MFSKQSAVLLFLGVGASAVCALQWDNDYLSRVRAHHVKRTILISAANRQLGGFFDGLQPDPHWNAAKATQAAQRGRRCGSAGSNGLMARILSVFERTVHAQGSCSGSCGGYFVNITTSNPCTTGMGCSVFSAAGNQGFDECTGSVYSGLQGCTGGTGCATICNVTSCGEPGCGGGGGCAGPDGACTQDSDCCSDDCDPDTLRCTDTEVRRGL
jgi:hypothetical protein